jgi:predicted enzyme related to lactoylglutathione lyase
MTKRNVVHIEIPAKDPIKAGQFYEQLFGWKIQTDPKMNYTMWEPAQGPGGGFNPLGEHTKPGDILIYVDSPDIEADLKRAEALGAKTVTPKTEIPTVGWFAAFKDPTGNTIALFTSLNPNPSG